MKQTLKYIYERLLDSFKMAETKHSITIALASAVIIFGSTFFEQQDILIKTLAAACVAFALISILYGFVALSARRIKLPYDKKPKKINNMMYYKIIIQFDEYSYVEEMIKRYKFPSSYKPDNLDYDLARQVIALAKVVNLKYLYFNLSLIFLFLSVMLGIGIIAILGSFL
ncbi:MAG: hypothetical protein PHC47_03400 [Clostridia bacterium]|jgi:hypothetical protein|nr:hypothetical protein [Clostridia bacterium]